MTLLPPQYPHSNIHSPYSFAQIVNDNAQVFMENGEYEQAIENLSKAIHVCRGQRVEEAFPVDNLCHCSRCDPKKSDHYPNDGDAGSCDETYPSAAGTFNCSYLHKKLMPLPCRSLHGDSSTVVRMSYPLILLFNLAIAHHLSATRSKSDPIRERSTVENTLQLYHVANSGLQQYATRIDYSYNPHYPLDATSIRLQLILCNNLGHLHCGLGNDLKQKQCIQRLIELTMCVIDYKVRELQNRNTMTYDAGQEVREICLEGFFQNISPWILRKQCADAA